MKKKLLLIAALMVMCTVYTFAQDTLIGWTFPTGTKADSMPDKGWSLPKTSASFTLKSDSAIKYITGTYASPPACAQGEGLISGAEQEKGWYIKFTTYIGADIGMDSLKLFSKQSACTMHSGPKYWKIQYKVNNGSWTDLSGGNVITGLNWTTGVVKALQLPETCWNTDSVYIRWIMTSDSNVPGSSMGTTLTSNGSMARIDDIFITGVWRTSINSKSGSQIKIYPNPGDGRFIIKSPVKIEQISIFSSIGKLVYKKTKPEMSGNFVDPGKLDKGVYIIHIKSENSVYTAKYFIK